MCTITTKPQVVPIPNPTMPKPIEPTTSDAKFYFDIDGCNISEVVMFLQKLARSPDASDMHVAFTNTLQMLLLRLRKRS